jgi:hypothetical protein
MRLSLSAPNWTIVTHFMGGFVLHKFLPFLWWSQLFEVWLIFALNNLHSLKPMSSVLLLRKIFQVSLPRVGDPFRFWTLRDRTPHGRRPVR